MVLSLTEKLKQIKLNMGGEELSLEDKLKQIKMNLQETTPTETTGLSLEEKLSKIKTNIESDKDEFTRNNSNRNCTHYYTYKNSIGYRRAG